MTPLAIKAPVVALCTIGTPHKIIKPSHLLNGVKSYILNYINKRLIFEDIWEVAFHLRNLVQIISSFFDYLQLDFEHDRHFVDNELSTFVQSFSSSQSYVNHN